MKIDFPELKERVKILDVAMSRYGMRPTISAKQDYAHFRCPLPTHPRNEKDKKFQVHLPTNRWTCKTQSCGNRNGVGDGWGDVINFVSLMQNNEGQYKAAQRILEWYPANKNGPHIESRRPESSGEKPQDPSQKDSLDDTKSSGSVKEPSGKRSNYLHDTSIWLDELLLKSVPDELVRRTIKKRLMDRVFESFRNGKKEGQEAALQS